MPTIDIEQLKSALRSLKGRKADRTAGAATEKAFHEGVKTRRKAISILAHPPDLPVGYIEIDTPFLIWAYPAPNIIRDSHIEPLNSWAKIYSTVNKDAGAFGGDQLSFYFLWQNTTGSDVSVNVETYLMLNGACEVHASHGWWWTPLWGATTIGSIDYTLSTQLTLYEWWNQPPTQPLYQADQLQTALELSASGGWGFLSPGETKDATVAENYHMFYSAFYIPNGKTAVFEVTLQDGYVSFNDTSGWTDFANGDRKIICPYLRLEVTQGAALTADAALSRNPVAR